MVELQFYVRYLEEELCQAESPGADGNELTQISEKPI